MTELIREVIVRPAYDERGRNCGVHGADLCFFLKGPDVAIQFIIYTNWQLPHVQEEFEHKYPDHKFSYIFHKPMPAEVGYHSRTPQYEGQTSLIDDCFVLGGPCYYDGSTLQAEEVFNIMVTGGSKAMWEELERRYYEIAGGSNADLPSL